MSPAIWIEDEPQERISNYAAFCDHGEKLCTLKDCYDCHVLYELLNTEVA